MNRIEYINQRFASMHSTGNDFAVISSLIHSLTPEEACSYFDYTFKQNQRIRHYLLKKIYNDISKSYTIAHKKLIATLIKKLDEKGFGKKDCCSHSLNFLLSSLPKSVRTKIFKIFLFSKSNRNRDRAFKKLNAKWDNKYFEQVEQVWHSYHDFFCTQIILNHFPTTFLLENYKTILQHSKQYQISKLFLKVGAINIELVADLKKIDEISYCYVLAKLRKTLSDEEAKEILKDNYKDDRIGLLLWSFGQMRLWDRIVEYVNNYHDKSPDINDLYINYLRNNIHELN